MGLSRDDYLTVQQIYRGWALLGAAVVAGLVTTAILAVREWGSGPPAWLAPLAAVCVAVSLVVFFAFTFPVNKVTENWTVLPDAWRPLRARWEYSHAANAALYLVALVSLVLSIIWARR